jgi:hypothetical protein
MESLSSPIKSNLATHAVVTLNCINSPHVYPCSNANINTLSVILSQTCYSRDTPARGTRGPHKVRDNLH